MASERIITCKHCGDTKRHGAYGWCHACYTRWDRAGRPEDGPPQKTSPLAVLELAWQAHSERRKGRLEDYQDLRSWGLTVERAARRLGLSERTAWRYEAALRAEEVSA